MTVAAAGCARVKTTQFEVVDYRSVGEPARYFQPFEECYYRIRGRENLDLVARRESVDADGVRTLQVVHLRTFWRAVPGRTQAEDTMINTTVSYLIISGPTGASFEGSGFMTFRENRKRTQVKGTLELASLTPQRRLGNAEKLFERAELSGSLVATRDDRKVISILHEMQRLFGPMPRYVPPPEDPDLQ